MSTLRLHVDADASSEALHRTLTQRGHDVIRMPTDGMLPDACDEEQLLGATGHGREILTLNARDFLVLAKQYSRHGGIILAAQSSWTLLEPIGALSFLLSESEANQFGGPVRWR